MKSCDISRELFQSSKRKSACADKSDGNEGEDPRESKACKILSISAIDSESRTVENAVVLH